MLINATSAEPRDEELGLERETSRDDDLLVRLQPGDNFDATVAFPAESDRTHLKNVRAGFDEDHGCSRYVLQCRLRNDDRTIRTAS